MKIVQITGLANTQARGNKKIARQGASRQAIADKNNKAKRKKKIVLRLQANADFSVRSEIEALVRKVNGMYRAACS